MAKEHLRTVNALDGATVTAYAVGNIMIVECSEHGELEGSGGESRALASQYAEHHAQRKHSRR